MTYTLYDAQGQAIAGDATLGQNMKDRADEVQGHIVNDVSGITVYPLEG
ncbi:hypothetical protein SEA_MERCEDES_3 [Microbacterium phage Mercedes]|nr:hypothetical protein SEA_MERCEDES_3 [Microbacterium phage Mercedes]